MNMESAGRYNIIVKYPEGGSGRFPDLDKFDALRIGIKQLLLLCDDVVYGEGERTLMVTRVAKGAK